MKPILSGLLSVSALLFTACDSDLTRPETLNMEVMPFLVPCNGFISSTCLSAKERDVDTAFGNFFGPIEGFGFRWGKLCHLTVEKHPIKNPPSDGPSDRYVLAGNPVCSDEPSWTFEGMFRTTETSLAGDTLHIQGYTMPIRLLDAADRASLAALSNPTWARLTVEPGEGDWLKGHSVHEVVMHSVAP